MRPSLFTPTHDPRWLAETYVSLLAQTHQDWEWVIVPNQGATIPPAVLNDERVRTVELPRPGGHGIGALKRFACGRCTGDLLIELDHDDLLTPGAIERLLFHQGRTGAGFLYSDCVNFLPDGGSRTYDEQSGWETYPFTHGGVTYRALRSFPPCPRSLHHIWWAPNHVRAWTRAAYDRVGGHDPALAVGDDHDLICRTYLEGVEFCQIPEVLYLYRMRDRGGTDGDATNTHLRKADEIQRRQQEVSDRYTHPLVEEWCRRLRLPKVDLGGRIGCPKGYIAVDLEPPAEILCDVTDGLPFEDSTVGVVRAFDFLEHIPPGRPIIDLWNEIYRVLVPGGWFISRTPSTEGRGAWQDPTHVSFWNANSFWYVTRREQQRFVSGLHARFQVARIWDEFPSPWHEENKISYVCADLCALKGQRQPGPKSI